MLLEILRLLREAGDQPLTRDEIAARLDVAPAVLEHMLHSLVQRGHLLRVETDCPACNHCPLHRVCAGAPLAPQSGYRLKERRLHS